MYKVTYGTSNLFTLKKYENSNLNCQSYEYPTIYAVRSAILGAIIQVDGIEKAKELFHKVKNAIIYIQYPNEFKINGCRIKRFANSFYDLKDEQKIDRDYLISKNFCTSMGFREYVYLKEIVFYIDNSISDIELYLKNIDWLGTAESLVYLESIKETNKLDRILKVESNINCRKYEQYDWSSKVKFENVYMFSDKYNKRQQVKLICSINNIEM
ncbi:hypothetical protein UT300005_19560 [Clostridium sp. CTA-5]